MDEFLLTVDGWLTQWAKELGVADPMWLPISAAALLALLILFSRVVTSKPGKKPVAPAAPQQKVSVAPKSAPVLEEKVETKEKETVPVEEGAKVKEVPPPAEKTTPIEVISVPPTEHEVFATGLAKTRDNFLTRFVNLVKGRDANDTKLFEDLEELLITSDIGFKTSQKLLTAARETLKNRGTAPTEDSLVDILSKEIRGILLDDGAIELAAERTVTGPTVILVVGVNGAGKTTTIGKLAHRFITNNKKVLLAAADTFRAGAVEQLEVWAGRVGVELHRSAEGAKPSTVAYEAIHKGLEGNYDVVIVDTAGRLHTRVNLMNELGSVVSIIAREQPGAPHETILVVDGTSGQNALEQAREFNAKAKLTGVIVTKLDGTPKGGIVIAIKDEIGVPIRYVGLGEKIDALRPFSAEEFTAGLFGK